MINKEKTEMNTKYETLTKNHSHLEEDNLKKEN